MVVVGLLALAAVGGGAFWWTTQPRAIAPAGTASVAPSAAPTPTPTPTPTPSPTPSATATASATASAEPEVDAGTTGTLRAKSYGHRIYVDGRLVGESGKDVTLPCGPHKVKVGSQGTEKSVVIPCGARLDVD